MNLTMEEKNKELVLKAVDTLFTNSTRTGLTRCAPEFRVCRQTVI
jgi:hypothetical protein